MSIPKLYHKKGFIEKIISEWNNLYQNFSNNALLTKEFIPSIQSRLKAKHFHPSFKLAQFLTGHGNFKTYLKLFNLSPTDQCSCSSDAIQNAKHLTLACTKFSSEKRTLRNCLQKDNIVWPPPLPLFKNLGGRTGKILRPSSVALKSKNQEINHLQLAVKLPWAIFFENVDILS
ncbi:uncharacterized protein TNCV_3341821 [Trichonephila clavipes]|nr:uncharacterized protein TNCV_3341821 [Trichonephila clavipes]